jgi:hypothetical protein
MRLGDLAPRTTTGSHCCESFTWISRFSGVTLEDRITEKQMRQIACVIDWERQQVLFQGVQSSAARPVT